MGAYKLTPCYISSSDDPIPIVEAKIFNLYQNMMAAEKEEEEKTLLNLLNEVEEEQYEKQPSDGIFVHDANKLLGDDIVLEGDEAKKFLEQLNNPSKENIELRKRTIKKAKKVYKKYATRTIKLPGDET